MSEYAAPLLWSFLPAQITAALLPTLTAAAPRLLPPAQRGTPGYVRNFRVVITTLVLGWLLYAFATDRADDASGDWYALLGVPVRATDDDLKRAFRGLSRKYHPDRIGANAPPWVEARFIAMRAAYEALSDPVRRFAYDRFGPDIAGWQNAKTTRDYMVAGASRSAGFYVVTVGLLVGLSLLGRAREGAFWRLVLVGILLVAESSLVLAPTPGPDAPPAALPLLSLLPGWIAAPLGAVLPTAALDRPAYQYIKLLRRLTADAGVAISQLADVWADKPANKDNEQAALALAVRINQEALANLADEVGPVIEASNDPAGAERNLLDRIEQVVLDRGLASHPAVGPWFTDALERELKGKGAGVRVLGADATEQGGSNDAAVHEAREQGQGRGLVDGGKSKASKGSKGKATKANSADSSDDELGPDTFGSATTRVHELDFEDDESDRISPADLVELGKAMPLPPSPPATPAPESLGQVVDAGKAKEKGEKEAPRRRSARLSRSPARAS